MAGSDGETRTVAGADVTTSLSPGQPQDRLHQQMTTTNDIRNDKWAIQLGDASLRGVITDNTTTWPAGFTPPEPEG